MRRRIHKIGTNQLVSALADRSGPDGTVIQSCANFFQNSKLSEFAERTFRKLAYGPAKPARFAA